MPSGAMNGSQRLRLSTSARRILFFSLWIGVLTNFSLVEGTIYRQYTPSSPTSLSGFNVTLYTIDTQTASSSVYIQDQNGITTTLVSTNQSPQNTTLTSTYFNLLRETNTSSISIQLLTDNGRSGDAYFPLPETCWGTEYVVSSYDAGSSTSYAVILTSDTETFVNLTVTNDETVDVNGTSLTAGQSTQLTIPANTAQLITSTDVGINGVHVTSNRPVAVFTGNWGDSASKPSNLLEMLPSVDHLSTVYVVPLPTENGKATLFVMIKIVAVQGQTDVIIITTSSTVSNTLTYIGDTWRNYPQKHSVIQATLPVLVLQFVSKSNMFSPSSSSVMLWIPPEDYWTQTAAAHALNVEATSWQEVQIVTRTDSLSELNVTRLSDNSDLIPSLTFETVSVYSVAYLELPAGEVILFSHANSTFAVTQYGGVDSTTGGYAFPITVGLNCTGNSSSSLESLILAAAGAGGGSGDDDSINIHTKDPYFLLYDYWWYVVGLFIFLVTFATAAVISVLVIRKRKRKGTITFSKEKYIRPETPRASPPPPYWWVFANSNVIPNSGQVSNFNNGSYIDNYKFLRNSTPPAGTQLITVQGRNDKISF